MKILFDKETEGCVQDLVQVISWELLGGDIQLELPQGFQEMTPERRSEFYPYENRPEIILEDMESEVQITLQFLDKVMQEKETRTALGMVHELMEDAFSKYEITPAYLFEDGHLPIGWLLIKMKDRRVEHVKAIFCCKGKMTLLTVTYSMDEYIKWRALVKCIFKSITIQEGNRSSEKS